MLEAAAQKLAAACDGLAALNSGSKLRWEKLQACLRAGETLSAEDEDWLDNGFSARQDIDVTGSDEIDPVLSNPRPRSTQLETLAAAGVLEHYLEEEPEPFGFELDLLLSKLKYKLRLERTRALTTQPITNFFSRTSARAISTA